MSSKASAPQLRQPAHSPDVMARVPPANSLPSATRLSQSLRRPFRRSIAQAKTAKPQRMGNDDMALDLETREQLIDTVRRFVSERLRPLEAKVAEDDEMPADV